MRDISHTRSTGTIQFHNNTKNEWSKKRPCSRVWRGGLWPDTADQFREQNLRRSLLSQDQSITSLRLNSCKVHLKIKNYLRFTLPIWEWFRRYWIQYITTELAGGWNNGLALSQMDQLLSSDTPLVLHHFTRWCINSYFLLLSLRLLSNGSSTVIWPKSGTALLHLLMDVFTSTPVIEQFDCKNFLFKRSFPLK